MLEFLSWYLLITLVGWLAFPIAYRLLPALPERGYALSRALGWLVWGYLFWLLASLGVLQNNTGGVLLALILLAVVSGWAISGGRWREMVAWIRSRKRYVLAVEAVFFVAFAAWTVVRATNPDIYSTEKPMELAFINAILQSPSFPPSDPWLSGYAISYYYFGYVLVSMIIRLSGVISAVGFNLAIALLFGLTASGAYGLVYNLLALRRASHPDADPVKTPLGLPILGPFFVLIVSNLEGFLEVLYAKGLFWYQSASGVLQSGFWSWLNILELNQPPSPPFEWMPHRAGLIWWRASRVLQDFNYAGVSKEIIDEFPFFSYLLADLHPHVLAIPFAMVMMGLALNVYLRGFGDGFQVWGLRIPFGKSFFLLSAVALGGMAFLNTWDFPIYVGLVAGAYTLQRLRSEGWGWERLGDFLGLALLLGVSGAVLYLPFYIGFSSQAGGPLPSVLYFTRGTQFWVMFAPLVLPLFAYLIYRQWKYGGRSTLLLGAGISLAAIVVLWASSYLYAIGISDLPGLGTLFMDNLGATGASIWAVIGTSLVGRVLPDGQFLAGRLTAPGAWLSLAALVALTVGLLLRQVRNRSVVEYEMVAESVGVAGSSGSDPLEFDDPLPEAKEEEEEEENPAEEKLAHGFWLLMVLFGALLVLIPEFYYLRDVFGTRMNTVFKFYYQAWLLWGIGAAFAVACMLEAWKRVWGLVFRVGLGALLLMALAYPVFSLYLTTDGFHPAQLTLDGNAYLQQSSPDEYGAIQWLLQHPRGVIAEAEGQSYQPQTALMATRTGYPDILGWEGHELQWRGGVSQIGNRPADLQTLYQTADWAQALSILQKYQVRYVVVGPAEHAAYHVSETKFQQNLPVGYQSGSVTIYEVPALDLTVNVQNPAVGAQP
ncbi:MAG: DUF2298 domain-containing protein [Chloroflexi bacterium]|nr:DUF2298 domain-containing protein [Chloroflexota bacterium]